jgi:polyphenol oxidase
MSLPQPNRAFEWTQAPWGPALRCIPLAGIAPHYFTVGNLQLRQDVCEWTAVASAMQVPPAGLRLIRQVHGTAVAIARSASPSSSDTPEADVIISDDPALAVAVRVADCAPILLADRSLGVVGAAHAGWRGTVGSAAAQAVHAMQREFGSSTMDIIAAIGPCLGSCCGEVGEEVLDAFRQAGHPESALARWLSPGSRGRPMLDLSKANVDQLSDAGVPRSNIFVAELCTKTHAGLMHSYRASGRAAGRMLGVIRAVRPSAFLRLHPSRDSTAGRPPC